LWTPGGVPMEFQGSPQRRFERREREEERGTMSLKRRSLGEDRPHLTPVVGLKTKAAGSITLR